MRKPFVCGNWKMHKTRDEALQFIFAVNQSLPSNELVDVAICAPSIILRDLVKRQGDIMKIGAQNMHFADSGAYTGEVSPEMLKTTGVEYVIIGHSERRTYFNETDETVNLKLKAAIKYQLTPILCVGETLEERKGNTTKDKLKLQLEKAFADISNEDAARIIVAYEPLWAIGTGLTASKEVAEETIAYIREVLANLYGTTSDVIRLLYGGSVSADNANALMNMPNIDGVLVGGASLYPESFIAICNQAIK